MRVLFTTQPASGHFHPLVPFARAVADAGHDVAFATSPSFCRNVESVGFRGIPAGLDWLESEPEKAFPEFRELGLDVLTGFFLNIFFNTGPRAMLPDLLAATEAWRPDIVVRECWEPAGHLLAELLGVPFVTVGISVFFPPEILRDHFAGPMDETRGAHGLPPDPRMERLFGEAYLHLQPPRYQSYAKLLPNTEIIRPCVFDQYPGDDLPAWVGSLKGRPTVYASLGTVINQVPGVFEKILEGLRDEPINLILTVGRNGDPERFGPQPENVHIERFVPQSLLFPYCDVVVTHGGYNTVMATLSAGLPMLVVPVSTDGPLHAGCCAELGVAKVLLPPEMTPEAIRDAVRDILVNPSYKAQAQVVQKEIEALPGPERVVDLLEEIVRRRVGAG